MAEPPKQLSPDQCRDKAHECRELSRQAQNDAHKIMLMHMADTWSRIGTTLPNGHDK
jgi:hypothetical protein